MIQFLRNHVWQPLQETIRHWLRDDGPLLSAAVAYYVAISLFPLLLILIAALGVLTRYTHVGAGAEEKLLEAIAQQGSVALAENVREAFARVKQGATASGPIGLVTLLIAALAIFAQFQRAFDRIWNVPPLQDKGLKASVKNLLVKRLRAFLMLLGVGLFVAVVFVTGLTLSTIQAYAGHLLPGGELVWWWIQFAASLVLNAAAFTIVYKTLPKVRIRWSEAVRGAAVATVTWEIGRQILANVAISGRYSAYGVVGALLAVMLWAYYAANVIFLGAEYIQTYCRRCDAGEGVAN